MIALYAATALFLLTHFVPSTPLRGALVGAMGERRYRGLYVLVAFVTIGWMIRAWSQAPVEPLWNGLRHVPIAVMPFAFVLLACGLGRNPTAVGGEQLLDSDEPARGAVRVTRHPVMWAFMLWSGAHVAANGDLKSLVFFGAFFFLAGAGTLAIDRRKRASPGWHRFAAVTSNVPFVAIAQGRNRVAWSEIGWRRPLAGLALFGIVLAAHPWLFGARPY